MIHVNISLRGLVDLTIAKGQGLIQKVHGESIVLVLIIFLNLWLQLRWLKLLLDLLLWHHRWLNVLLEH